MFGVEHFSMHSFAMKISVSVLYIVTLAATACRLISRLILLLSMSFLISIDTPKEALCPVSCM